MIDQVEEQVEKKLDKIVEQFKKDLKKKVPESESKLAIETAALAGKAVPTLASGGAWAAIRSVVPGLGTFSGALLEAGANLGKEFLRKIFSS